MWLVLESKAVKKQLDKCPKEILKQYEAWKRVVELSGPHALRAIPGFKDHALRGEWIGARSSYLNIQWRVVYCIENQAVQIKVLEVTPHDYRKKS